MSLIIFLTVFALLFYTIVFGMLLGLKYKDYFFEEVLLELIPKSLFLSWIVVFISYFLKLPDLLWFLFLITIAVLIWRKQQVKIKFDPYSITFFTLAIIIGFLLIVDKYDWTFTAYDAVVSWNRWARELFTNEYQPMNAAYPLFLPGLWSLIYKAQGHTDIWIIQKLSLFIIPFLIILSNIAVFRKNFIVGLCSALAIAWIFFYNLSGPMLNGYMDGPLAGLVLVGVLIWVLSNEYEKENIETRNKFIYITSFVFGIAAVTKQAGLLVLLLFLFWLINLVYKKRLNLKVLAQSLFITLLPGVLFYAIFSQTTAQVIGNLGALKNLSEQRTNGEQIAVAFNYLETTVSPILLYVLLFLSVLNIFFIKKTRSQIGLLLLILACLGFYLYQDCCSYDARNGWWLISLLLGSAMCASLHFKSYRIHHYVNYRFKNFGYNSFLVIAFLALVSLVCSMVITTDQLDEITEIESKRLIPSGVDIIKHIPDLGEDGLIISKAFPMAYHRKLYGKVVTTFTNFETLYAVDDSYDIHECHNQIVKQGKNVKSFTLEGLMICKPNSLVHITNAHMKELKMNNPQFDYITVDSLKGYKLVKPVLKIENNKVINGSDY